MPRRKKRQPTPKSTSWLIRWRIAANVLMGAYYALKIGLWVWSCLS